MSKFQRFQNKGEFKNFIYKKIWSLEQNIRDYLKEYDTKRNKDENITMFHNLSYYIDDIKMILKECLEEWEGCDIN